MSDEIQMERKSFLATLLMNIFLGCLGVHRFYTGYVGIGVAQLLTLGGCGIWALVDFFLICLGKYKDSSGQELEDYNQTIGMVAIVILVLLFLFRIFAAASGAGS